MCLWFTNAPSGNKVQIWQNLFDILIPPQPEGHVMTGMNISFYTNDFLLVLATCVPSINNPDRFGYLNVNFIPCLIALFITQSVHREYSSVNDINYIYSSIMLYCWFVAQFWQDHCSVEQIAEWKSTVKVTLVLSTIGKSHLRNVLQTCNHILSHHPSLLP